MKSYFWSFHKELSRQSVATIHCLHAVVSPLCCERKHFKSPQFLLLSKTNNSLQVVKDRRRVLVHNLTLMWHWAMLKALTNVDNSSSFPLGFFLYPPSPSLSVCARAGRNAGACCKCGGQRTTSGATPPGSSSLSFFWECLPWELTC